MTHSEKTQSKLIQKTQTVNRLLELLTITLKHLCNYIPYVKDRGRESMLNKAQKYKKMQILEIKITMSDMQCTGQDQWQIRHCTIKDQLKIQPQKLSKIKEKEK